MPSHPDTTHPDTTDPDTTDAMTPTSIMENLSSLPQSEPPSVAALRLSLRRSLQSQLQQLCTDFFDEVDDFLFASGPQGQFADDCVYMKAMRELRAKQRLFEETLQRAWFRSLQSGDSRSSSAGDGRLTRSDAVFEKVEIDLALQAMQRKASKFYLPFIRQIDTMNEKYRSSPDQQVIAGHTLIESTLSAFSQAQTVFSLDLDIRLIFIKLFEQNFLMKMEDLFLDIISTLKNVNDESSLVAPRAAAALNRPRFATRTAAVASAAGISAQPAQESDAVEHAVERWVRKTCSQEGLPFFVEKMIRTKWRGVMFLIGINRGTHSPAWSEAEQSISLLVAATTDGSGQNSPGAVELESMIAQIRQGFGLIQLDKTAQDQFFQELATQLEFDSDASQSPGSRSGSIYTPTGDSVIESTICPSGEKLLDDDDLNEIAKLVGTAQNQADNTMIERRLTDYFPEIEQLREGSPVELLLNGSYRSFAVSKNKSGSELYEISSNDDDIKITKSKLGLAISLQNGELRFLQSRSPAQEDQETILEAAPSPIQP